jgi:hypothetical protein
LLGPAGKDVRDPPARKLERFERTVKLAVKLRKIISESEFSLFSAVV